MDPRDVNASKNGGDDDKGAVIPKAQKPLAFCVFPSNAMRTWRMTCLKVEFEFISNSS